VTVTIAATLLGNIGVAVSHEIKRGRWRTRTIVTLALAISLGLGIVGAAVLVPLGLALTPGYRSVALIPVALPAMLITGTLTATLVALGRVQLRNLLQLVIPAATLVGVVVLVVLLAKGVTGAVIAWTSAQAVVAILALMVTARIWGPLEVRGISLELGRRMLLLGLRGGMVNVIGLLNYRIELYVLKAFRGVDAVGVYSVSISLAELLWIVPSAFATVTIASAVSSSDQDAVAAISQGVRAAIASTAVFGLALAAVAPFAIPLVFGDRFNGATVPLLILVPGVVAFAPGQLLAVYFSIRLGQMRIPLGVAVLSAVLTAVLAILLIPPLGLEGAALATAIGYTVSMLIEAILFSRRAGIGLGELIPHRADFLTYRTFTLGLLRR
jgi:O-antigen/teichoic acid export membrane protein